MRASWRALVLGAAGLAVAFADTSPAQVPRQDRQPAGSALRPAVMGPSGGVSTGHPLTTAAAFGILLKGGNAFDAGVASLLAGGVLEQDLYSLGGEALVLVYPKKEARVTSIVGQGWAPHAVDVDWYVSRGKTLQGEGLDPAVVPGALHAALTVLAKWGTMSFEDVAAPAIGYAERGFPIRSSTARAIQDQREFFERWPGNKTYWLKPDGSAYAPGETIKLPATARTLRRMAEAERGARARGRDAGIIAARDRFYKGDIAREMVAFLRKHDAPFDERDFAEYFARIEEPARTTYRGYTVYKHGFGSQGPVLLQTLNILEQFDLHAMGYASADYLHTVVEAMKLAYADRDSFYADPAFVKVPSEGLLSKAYAKERAALIESEALVDRVCRRRSAPPRLAGEAVAVLEGERPGRRDDGARGLRSSDHGVARTGCRGRAQGHDPYRGHRQGRKHLRRHAERRVGPGRRDSGGHGHRYERSRRAVLARQDASQPDSSTCAPALHVDAEPGVQGRHADDGAWHARRRQSGSDHSTGALERGGVLGRLVSQPARRVRAAARADAAFLWVVLAARSRVQPTQRGGDGAGRRVRGAPRARPQRDPAAAVWDVGLRYRCHDRPRIG